MNTSPSKLGTPAPGWLRTLTAAWLLLLPLAGLASKAAPTIRLFPTTVLEEIRRTGDAAKEMETGLQAVIARLDEQQRLYKESRCEGGEADPGCERLSRQLGATYLEMLNVMGDKLPAMDEAVSATSSSLEKRIRKELGYKQTSWTLQDMLLSEGQRNSDPGKPALRGRTGMRLSDRFSQYYQLVARPGAQTNSSLVVLAADIYLDMQETSMLISRTREEIERARLMEQLNQSFGTITPEMQEVVAGVKAILFGEEYVEAPVAGPPVHRAEQEYASPLQL